MALNEFDIEAKYINTEPSEKQKLAGNYRKGHVRVKGFQITIETPKGAYRRGKDANGHEWKTLAKNHYGYFTSTVGKDKDAVDVYIGPKPQSFDTVYVIDQNNADGTFDESKVMFGFKGIKSAKRAYLSNYNNKTWYRRIRAITAISIDDFKEWLYRERKQRKPFSEYVKIMKQQLMNEEHDIEFVDAGTDFDVLDFKRVKNKNTGKMNLRNKETGELLSKVDFDWVGEFIGEAAIVSDIDKGYNFIDKDGDLVSDEWFTYVDEFRDGLAMVFKKMGPETYYNQIDIEGTLQDEWQKV